MLSNSEEQHLINARDDGADELIRKPLASEELYARLRSAERLLRLQSELIRLASTDPLTGVFNRRVFFEQAEQLQRRSAKLAAIMFDVDHFKQINDNFGHGVGDQVLGGIGREASSRGGLVGRLGGEEFAVLLEGTGLEAAAAHAEALRVRLALLSFDAAAGKLAVTCSLGMAEGQAGESVDQLLKRADAALYQAKASGRDRVVAIAAALEGGQSQWSGLLRTGERGTGVAGQAPEGSLHDKPHAA